MFPASGTSNSETGDGQVDRYPLYMSHIEQKAENPSRTNHPPTVKRE